MGRKPRPAFFRQAVSPEGGRCWLPDRRRRGGGRPGRRRGAAKLPQGFELAIYEIGHAGELRRHDLLDALSWPGNKVETRCGARG